uniref:PH domain-containing protein n=1 Tax=Rhodnius prolixus TaxID=13249 RepID=T1HLU5_RHOPR
MASEHEQLSEEDEDSDNGLHEAELQGVLNKWTNYIHGWQSRFIVLKDGILSYYKSQEDKGFGCRGAISLFKASIKVNHQPSFYLLMLRYFIIHSNFPYNLHPSFDLNRRFVPQIL